MGGMAVGFPPSCSALRSSLNGASSRFFLRPTSLLLRPPPRLFATVAFSRRRKSNTPDTISTPPKDKTRLQNDDEEGHDIDEDAFEALFSQLEEDLKNDDLSNDDVDGQIIEEDLAKLEQELAEALGYDENDEFSVDSPSHSNSTDNDNEFDKEESLPTLKTWQLKRLARALKVGRRKTSIKSLAAELGLDRALVLELLRDPPPNLLLICASLPDEDPQPHPEPQEPLEPLLTDVRAAENKPTIEVPVHVMQTRWIMQKRLKKVQVETLERVYSRTKRPTNAMISSIVHVTNLPWKRVVKWFEDKRLEDGVPKQRVPFRRFMHENMHTN